MIPEAEYEALRQQLRELGATMRAKSEQLDDLMTKRTELVKQAKDAGMSWREAAQLLDMTEHGLIKTQRTRLGQTGQTSAAAQRRTSA